MKRDVKSEKREIEYKPTYSIEDEVHQRFMDSITPDDNGVFRYFNLPLSWDGNGASLRADVMIQLLPDGTWKFYDPTQN